MRHEALYININQRENSLKNLNCDGTGHIKGGRMSLEEAEDIILLYHYFTWSQLYLKITAELAVL